MYQRYAIYYLPPKGSELERFGAQWFGYDITNGQAVDPLRVHEFDLALMTQNARKYGFHATLMAPFPLRKKYKYDDLRLRVTKLAEQTSSFPVSALRFKSLSGHLTLIPNHHATALNLLEERLVTKLNKFRKKKSGEAFKKRLQVKLNALEREYLDDYGYPYVLDHFRFHFTLSDRADKPERTALIEYLERHFSEVFAQPQGIEELAIVGERSDGFFEEIERVPLGGT